jgi:AraC-like DNA-binding protein
MDNRRVVAAFVSICLHLSVAQAGSGVPPCRQDPRRRDLIARAPAEEGAVAYRSDWLVNAAERALTASPNMRLDCLAARCGVSLSTLRRVVRTHRGRSLRQWQQRLLLSSVLDQLGHPTSSSLKEISANLDFSDEGSFARWFRRQAGCTPSSFRSRTMHPVGVRPVAARAAEVGPGGSMDSRGSSDEDSHG